MERINITKKNKEEMDSIEHNIEDLSIDLLKILLLDRTTRKYIRWGTDNYSKYGENYLASQQITPNLISGKYINIIQPRIRKDIKERIKRTKEKAEVFTPSWICNEQNNIVDEAWFGRKNVFNYSNNNKWITNKSSIIFPENKTWKEYVDARRIEISCGEAPYLVSRYDTVSGINIPVEERIGFLDRKLRVINENIEDEQEWFKWTLRAYQSIYAYEYQGDNILLARKNLLYTFIDNMIFKFGHKPTLQQMKRIAIIISWNIWQMDGITMTVPYSEEKPEYEQLYMFSTEEGKKEQIPCKIYDWRANQSIEFKALINGK